MSGDESTTDDVAVLVFTGVVEVCDGATHFSCDLGGSVV